jgi:hypothetical protein
MQQGQVFELKKHAVDGRPVWAYRYRTDGPGSRRLQRGGGRALGDTVSCHRGKRSRRAVDVRWTPKRKIVVSPANNKS